MVPASANALEVSLPFVHRENIHKYTRLLRTVLTEHERAFIQQRLNEERCALADLQRSTYAASNCG